MAHTEINKIITLDQLAQYNHKLISKLGLDQDTAEYTILDDDTIIVPTKSETGEWTNVEVTVKGALDQLYRMFAITELQAGTGVKIESVYNTAGKCTGKKISVICDSEEWQESDFPFDVVEEDWTDRQA